MEMRRKGEQRLGDDVGETDFEWLERCRRADQDYVKSFGPLRTRYSLPVSQAGSTEFADLRYRQYCRK